MQYSQLVSVAAFNWARSFSRWPTTWDLPVAHSNMP